MTDYNIIVCSTSEFSSSSSTSSSWWHGLLAGWWAEVLLCLWSSFHGSRYLLEYSDL